MKVHYRVQDRKLSADNSIVLNQLTFGSRVESPDAIKVPVLLAVALLKDRNGVIDFDLPVGGSLDDPEFSVGGLVVRAIVNLFVKVVTSPFALLSKLGGHHEELAFIEFPPGSASLDAAAQAKIDALGKALGERPGLKLDIAGRVDRAVDAAAMKHASMERKVRVQKFQDLERARQAPPSVDAVQVAADEYEALLRRAVRAETGLPRDVAAKVKDMQRAELEAMLQSLTVVADEDLRDLAYRRADAVRDRLASQSQLPADRVLLVAPKLDASDIKDGGKTTRVDFALR